MKRNQGFTIIEFSTILVLLVVLAGGVATAVRNAQTNSDNTACKGGYKFVGNHHQSPQILDSQGHGIPCNEN